MQYTLEQKIDIALRYIASDDPNELVALKKLAVEALATVTRVDTNIDTMVSDMLKNIGMPPHLIGYSYVEYAIRISVEDPSYLRDITSRLYSEVARTFDTTSSRAERAIRHAIEVAFDRGDQDAIRDIFGNTISVDKGKLTNSEFLSFCAYDIARKLKKRGYNVNEGVFA